MTFDQFTAHINDNIESRFSNENQNDIKSEMMSLASEKIADRQVLRFCRLSTLEALDTHWKTLLIVGITSDSNLREALQWVALCKELLLDPGTADLYLFIIWTGENKPSIEECLRIEASEDFCRKFVLRPNETNESFIERTFITKVDIPTPVDLGQDPLISAFSGLEEQFAWFDDDEKAKWREAFNSGNSSFDLFNALINYKSENNEAS
ncbi:MAG: ABC-three component system middle component 1 [Ferruginibacter sp.]